MMSCCSKRKKRWPMIVFFLVIATAILLAVITDAKAQTALQSDIAKSPDQLSCVQQTGLNTLSGSSQIQSEPLKTHNPAQPIRQGIHQ